MNTVCVVTNPQLGWDSVVMVTKDKADAIKILDADFGPDGYDEYIFTEMGVDAPSIHVS